MVNIWHQLCVHVYELNILHFLHVCFFPPDVLGSTSIPHPARRWWYVVCLQPLAWRRRAVMITTWMPVWNTARKTCWNLSSTSTMMCCQSSEVLAKWFSLRWDESRDSWVFFFWFLCFLMSVVIHSWADIVPDVCTVLFFLKVSCNFEPHLRGNVYVQFDT